ncbi:LPS export ABC transporter ATP-binding protein [Blattabacterium cuenoti]|uniref:ABC transporter, ATP-binding protein n=1 Tax=Blattabacterium cuenoti BPAA TaxID=1229512 RepID=M4ZSH4_9FLAO|nr:LPS export ABC transporter ATP-binding protein [Blattabacterium cuenoti]BAM99328.1 ABC transporter, ATP-binding protein [Blattabacterium cuenoti BPAA]
MTLKASNIYKKYRNKYVVNNVSIQLNKGEIVGLIGPNGAGKTTSFYMIVGLIKPDRGKIVLLNQDITFYPMHHRTKIGIGYLAQEPSIFRKLSVEDNILCILEMQNISNQEKKRITEKLIKELGLQKIRNHRGDLISGGERRRTEIARCLAINPKFILLDEPFSGIDPITIEELQKIIFFLKKKNIGILITDHNIQEIVNIADRIYLMFNGEIMKCGSTIEILQDPLIRKIYLGNRIINLKKNES